MLAEVVDLVIGVDTHTDTHTAAVVAVDTRALMDTVTVSTDAEGFAELLAWAQTHSEACGGLRAWAIEGAGGYGAGLARYLAQTDEWVIEVDRPVRPKRHAGAKSDAIDAERAARDALTRTTLAAPKTGPQRAALAALLVARRSAVEAATTAQRQLRALVITAPEQTRARFRGLTTRAMIATASRVRPTTTADVEVFTVLSTLRALGRRIQALQTEAAEHEHAIRGIVRSWRPDLLDQAGVGPIVAAVVLTAWSHPGRCRCEAAFAMLAGAAPIPASSGKTVRYRLNRAGNRQLNRALHTIALSRLLHDPDTRAYAERRRAEGKTDREIKRCLKRYIARQLYRQLENPSEHARSAPAAA
jgi:hypothetical protein